MGVVSYLLNYGVFKHYATLNAYDVNLDQVLLLQVQVEVQVDM
jgi:hypothetical protein